MTGVASGHRIVGSSWLHRRHPLTKLLAVLLVLVSAFLMPPLSLPMLAATLVVLAISAGLGGAVLRSLRITAVLFASIVVVNALFFPGGQDVVVRIGPLAITREGLSGRRRAVSITKSISTPAGAR